MAMKAHHRYLVLGTKEIVTLRGLPGNEKAFVSRSDGQLCEVDEKLLFTPTLNDEIRALDDKEMLNFLEFVDALYPDVEQALVYTKCASWNLPQTVGSIAFNGVDGKRVSLNDALANLELACDQRGYCG